jgi:methyl-accepting chemotaxis protein
MDAARGDSNVASQQTSIGPVVSAVGLVLVALAGIGFVAYERAGDQLMEDTGDKYVALMQLRRDALHQHLERAAGETRYFAGDRNIREIIEDLGTAWDHLGPRGREKIRRAYTEDSPHPVGERHKLQSARDGSAYSTLHGAHHRWLRRFLEQHGYYDVFLFDPNGDLLYTASKESDFGTNLVGGPYRESGLGEAFRTARQEAKPGTVAFADFRAYAPSHGAAAAFMASPVLADDGRLLGVLAFQLSTERIDEIMQKRVGLGETGETYVVGPDYLMRSNSRFATASTILSQRVETRAAKRALAGQTDVEIVTDYRAIPVLSAYGPLDFMGTRWAVLAEVDEVEILAPIRRLRNFLIVSIVIAMFVVSAIGGVVLSWTLRRPAPPEKRAHQSIG